MPWLACIPPPCASSSKSWQRTWQATAEQKILDTPPINEDGKQSQRVDQMKHFHRLSEKDARSTNQIWWSYSDRHDGGEDELLHINAGAETDRQTPNMPDVELLMITKWKSIFFQTPWKPIVDHREMVVFLSQPRRYFSTTSWSYQCTQCLRLIPLTIGIKKRDHSVQSGNELDLYWRN